MLLTTKVEETYTVEDFIELGSQIDDLQYHKFIILSKAVSNVTNYIMFAEHNVIYDYEEEFGIQMHASTLVSNQFYYFVSPKPTMEDGIYADQTELDAAIVEWEKVNLVVQTVYMGTMTMV